MYINILLYNQPFRSHLYGSKWHSGTFPTIDEQVSFRCHGEFENPSTLSFCSHCNIHLYSILTKNYTSVVRCNMSWYWCTCSYVHMYIHVHMAILTIISCMTLSFAITHSKLKGQMRIWSKTCLLWKWCTVPYYESSYQYMYNIPV